MVMGDFNLHLHTWQEEHLTQAEKSMWGARIGENRQQNPSPSEHRFWNTINIHEYIVSSSRNTPTPDNGPPPPNPVTWVSPNRNSSATSIIDYVLCNSPMQHMITQCHPITGSHIAIRSDHNAIHSNIHIPSRPHRDPNTLQNNAKSAIHQKERIRFTNLQIPEYREAHDKAVEKASQALAQDIQQTIDSAVPSQEKIYKIFSTFTTTQLKIAEEALGKYEIRTSTNRPRSMLGPTMTNLQSLGLRIPQEYRKERADAFKAFKQAHTDSNAGRPPPNMQDISHTYRKTCEAAINKATEIQDEYLTQETAGLCFTEPQHSRKNIWTYRKTKSGPKIKDTLPPYMKDHTGSILPTQEQSAKVWHITRRKIHGPHQTQTPLTTEYLATAQNNIAKLHQNSHTQDDPTHTQDNNVPFTPEQLHEVVRALPAGKAADTF
jgi:hypothetical protein